MVVHRRVLVIGATGVLRPAINLLLAQGRYVIPVSRHGADNTIAADTRDTSALAQIAASHAWHDAIAYGPALSEDSHTWLQQYTGGRLVVVRTSQWGDPARGPLTIAANTLQLGWRQDSTARWHSPEEISAAAVEILDDGLGRQLGMLRPWRQRPT